MTKKEFRIYPGMVNFTIGIDENNQVTTVQFGNDLPYYRTSCFSTRIITENIALFKGAVKYMLIANPKDFTELYKLLKENDPEMFVYMEEIVTEIGAMCLNLSMIE